MKPNKRIIVAKGIDRGIKNPRQSADKLAAQVCFHYPVYKLSEARRLPAKDAMLLLNTANQIKAADYFELTQISVAPHTRKAQGVRRLLERYKEIANGK